MWGDNDQLTPAGRVHTLGTFSKFDGDLGASCSRALFPRRSSFDCSSLLINWVE